MRRKKTEGIVAPALLLSLLFVLNSCQSFKAPEFKNVDNIRIARTGKPGTTLLANVNYYNPNPSKLVLKRASGEAWIDDQYLGTFRVDSLVRIGGESDFSLPLILETEARKLLPLSVPALLKKEVTIRVKGTARVGKGILFINYPINYEGKQSLEKLFN